MKGNHARMNQRNYQLSVRRKRTYSWSKRHYEATRSALEKEVAADYELCKQYPENDHRRKILRRRIDEKIENWNENISPWESYDFHGMTAKGAARYAIKIIKRELDEKKDKENSGNFQRALKFITGYGSSSDSNISAIQQAMVAAMEKHKEQEEVQYDAKGHTSNPGVVWIFFD